MKCFICRWAMVVLMLASFWVGCSHSDLGTTIYDVEYRVTGTAATASMTIENEDGGTSQVSNQPLPWSHAFTARPGTWVYVSAQNEGDTGDITAAIYYDGTLFKSSTSTGAYVIASAYGTLP